MYYTHKYVNSAEEHVHTICASIRTYVSPFQVYFFIAHLVISYMLAFGLALLVESPMIGLEKIIFRSTSKPKKITSTTTTNMTESTQQIIDDGPVGDSLPHYSQTVTSRESDLYYATINPMGHAPDDAAKHQTRVESATTELTEF